MHPSVLWLAAGAFLLGQLATALPAASEDTATVYGPYRVLRLPVTKGVRVLNPIQISQGPGGRIFAANQNGAVYWLRDSDGDGLEDEAVLFCDVSRDGLHAPAGFAFRGDTVYIGTREEIRAYRDMDGDGRADSSTTFFKDIPHGAHPYEWTSGLCFGPDGALYCALATDSWNAGASPDPHGYRGSLLRIAADGKSAERVATGLRSAYGMAFNPHGDLFFTDNEGGGNPKEELNRLVRGRFYGHNGKKFGSRENPPPTEGPVLDLEHETAPGGIEFNPTTNAFGGTAGDLFIAYYGPGERWNRGGVGRVRITRQSDGTYRYEEFPVLDLPKLSDLAFGPDGTLYLAQHGKSDYWYNPTEARSGAFFKVIVDPTRTAWPHTKPKPSDEKLPGDAVAAGRELFAQRACSACHETGGGTERLGPTLAGIGHRLTRAEILEDINEPSKRIKPSLAGVKITRQDGRIVLGRVVHADEHQLSVMVVGNAVVSVPRHEIAASEEQTKSLMPERLLQGLSAQETEALLSYLLSLK